MNVYHGLLFLGGYIADPTLARRLGRETPAAAGADTRPADTASVAPAEVAARTAPIARLPVATARATLAARLRWLLEELVILGGRPVSADHLDDLDEPFPDLHPCH